MENTTLGNERSSIFLTTTQAADLLNISNATLKKFIALGKVRTFKTPGGHHRIKKDDLLHDLYEVSLKV